MIESKVDVKTQDGVADGYLYHPDSSGTWPAVIMYTDIKGVRSAFQDMAKRLAAEGYVVFLPNVYYRTRHMPVFKDELPSFNEANGRTQLLALRDTLTPDRVERDAISHIEFLGMHKNVGGTAMGTVGYCMAGAIALRTAAARPDRIASMASFHGGHLATDTADSPHLLLPKVKARLYFAHASEDASCPPAMIDKLEAACSKTGLRYESDVYGGRHGFAVKDHAAFDEASCDRHWRKMLVLFKETLH